MKTRALIGMAALLLAAACGQKGPLYLPDEGGEVVTRPAGQTQPGQTQTSPQSTETAPQPSTQPPDTTVKPDNSKKESTPR